MFCVVIHYSFWFMINFSWINRIFHSNCIVYHTVCAIYFILEVSERRFLWKGRRELNRSESFLGCGKIIHRDRSVLFLEDLSPTASRFSLLLEMAGLICFGNVRRGKFTKNETLISLARIAFSRKESQQTGSILKRKKTCTPVWERRRERERYRHSLFSVT